MASQFGPPLIDFSALASIPDSYYAGRKMSQQQGARDAFAGGLPRAQDGSVDFAAASDIAARNGDLEGSKSFAVLADTRELHRASIENMKSQRGFQERTTRIAEKSAEEKPQYMQSESPDGSKLIIKLEPYGKGASVVTPAGQPTGGGNPFSYGNQKEDEHKSSGYANRMFEAEKAFRDPNTSAAGSNVMEVGKSRVPLVGNYLVSDDYQKFDQASRDFINATLRRESGAAIAQSEFDNAYKQYLPRPGDSAAVLAQKQRNRQTAIASIAGGGGKAYKPPYTFGPNGEMQDTGAGMQGSCGAAPQSGGQGGGGNAVLQQARDAIARGANREQVIQRLRQNGIDPLGL